MSGTAPTGPAPGTGPEALADEGPLHFTARALVARLQTVLPPPWFDYHYLDGRLSKAQWGRLTRRTPAVCVGWAGVVPLPHTGGVFAGTGKWFVGLITRNEAGPAQRLLGDRFAPGVLSLVRAATIALQGYVIDPPCTPWTASGAVQVTAVQALYSDDWTDEACSLVGIDLDIEYEEMLPPAFDTSAGLDAIRAAWSFAGPAGAAVPLFTETVELPGP